MHKKHNCSKTCLLACVCKTLLCRIYPFCLEKMLKTWSHTYKKKLSHFTFLPFLWRLTVEVEVSVPAASSRHTRRFLPSTNPASWMAHLTQKVLQPRAKHWTRGHWRTFTIKTTAQDIISMHLGSCRKEERTVCFLINCTHSLWHVF